MLMITALFSGCGSNFEWFPKGGAFSNTSTVVSGTAPGTVMREIPFPTTSTGTVKAVSDVAYDRNSATFWMLAVINGDITNAPDSLVQITANGVYITKVDANSWPLTILNGSTLTHDGKFFWVTSAQKGANASEIFLIYGNGLYNNNKYPCTAVATDFCKGLAWDSTMSQLWSATADSAKLVQFGVTNGTVSSTGALSGLWSGGGVTDVAFDNASGEVFVVKGGVIRVRGSSGAGLGTIGFSVPGDGRGDWDGQYFWVVDNAAKKIKALFVR